MINIKYFILKNQKLEKNDLIQFTSEVLAHIDYS